MTIRKRFALIVAVLVMAMLAMNACSKNTLVMNSESEKSMTVEVTKAATGDFALTGSLEVAEGEQVVMTQNMEKGEVLIELYGTPAEQSAEEMPDIEGGEPVMKLNADGAGSMSGTLPAGSYMVKATVIKKASGTVQIDVTEAENK